MNRNPNTKRLSLRREVILSLTQLRSVVGGAELAAITRPPVSCAMPCPTFFTDCGTCELATYRC